MTDEGGVPEAVTLKADDAVPQVIAEHHFRPFSEVNLVGRAHSPVRQACARAGHCGALS